MCVSVCAVHHCLVTQSDSVFWICSAVTSHGGWWSFYLLHYLMSPPSLSEPHLGDIIKGGFSLRINIYLCCLFLLVRDGPDTSSPQLGVFSGNTALESAYSTSLMVLIRFHSDFSTGGFFILNFHGKKILCTCCVGTVIVLSSMN